MKQSFAFFVAGFVVATFFISSVALCEEGRLVVESTPTLTWERKVVDDSDALSRLIQQEWERDDKIDGSFEAYRAAIADHLGRAEELLDYLADELATEFVADEREKLASLRSRLEALDASTASSRAAEAEALYVATRGAKRRIVFANPLYQGYPLLFCKRTPPGYNHMVAQYFGWRARSGGGLYVLEEPGRSTRVRALTDGKLPKGSCFAPNLSYDGSKIVFSFVDLTQGENYNPLEIPNDGSDLAYYHLYTVNVDGSELRQLTSGPFEDLMPTWLPDGDLAFVSTRRRGNARCFWWMFSDRWNTFTLHRMKPDGSGLKTLSFHDTSEWFPSVSHDGSLIYSRWDYIDRDAVTHQNLWRTRPDGTNPQALWGNATPNPLCAFQARPIPDSSKFLFVASAHHSVTGGSLALLDPAAGVDGAQAITRVTPDVPFPESEGWGLPQFYHSPFPLSEDFYIVSYSPFPLRMEGDQPIQSNALGIYALDVFGNRELLYRDPELCCLYPIPLRPTTPPNPVHSALPENSDSLDYGEASIDNIYEGLGPDVQPGSIKSLRVVQIYPKTTRDWPPVGLGGEENARAILGEVPVEADGSAYFRVPARVPLLFQALDSEGRAYQTMRSVTYLQGGERVSCVGCHESRDADSYVSVAASDSTKRRSIATSREPSVLDPGEIGGRPFSFMEVVQPILDEKCVCCHNDDTHAGGINLSGERGEPNRDLGMTILDEGTFNARPVPSDLFSQSYYSLCQGGTIFWGDDGSDPNRPANALVPRFGGRNTIQVTEPGGKYGSRGAKLMKMLRDGHANVSLSDSEFRRLCAWIDLNAVFYGVYDPEEQARQFSRENVTPPEIQ